MVLALCRKNGSVSRKDVQEVLQVSQSTAILLLKKMVGDDTLAKTGSGREVRYAVK